MVDGMVKIVYAPSDELIVHDVIRLDKDDMLRRNITPNGNMPLYWCDGILYSFASPPITEQVVSELLKGRIHWLEVQFHVMEGYVPMLSLNEDEYKSVMNFRVINTSNLQLHKEFIRWLKTNVK
jgi:hypothetical protein